MMVNTVHPASAALVQVWGKGFRVSEGTEEFQRLVPSGHQPPQGLEGKLSQVSWGPVLEGLYKLSDREVAAQRVLLFDSEQMMALSFARSEDRHGRPAVVLVSAVSEADWNSTSNGGVAARLTYLAGRLAAAYAEAFRGGSAIVGQQLRDGTFLSSRAFEVDEEQADVAHEWPSIMEAVKRWRGISGLATPRLLSVGANIALGTRHEAERAQQGTRVDGFYDVREKAITPLSLVLTPWAPLRVETSEHADAGLPVTDGHPTAHSLDRIADALEAMVDVGREILQALHREKRKR